MRLALQKGAARDIADKRHCQMRRGRGVFVAAGESHVRRFI